MLGWLADVRTLSFVVGGFLLPTTFGVIWRNGALLLDISARLDGQVLMGLLLLTFGIFEMASASVVPAFCFSLFRSDGARIESRYRVPLICAALIMVLSSSRLIFEWLQVAAVSVVLAGTGNVLAASRDACFAFLLLALSRSAGVSSSVSPAFLVRISRFAIMMFGITTLLSTVPYVYSAVLYVQDGLIEQTDLQRLQDSLLPGAWAFLRALASIIAPFAVWRSTKVRKPVSNLLEDREAL